MCATPPGLASGCKHAYGTCTHHSQPHANLDAPIRSAKNARIARITLGHSATWPAAAGSGVKTLHHRACAYACRPCVIRTTLGLPSLQSCTLSSPPSPSQHAACAQHTHRHPLKSLYPVQPIIQNHTTTCTIRYVAHHVPATHTKHYHSASPMLQLSQYEV